MFQKVTIIGNLGQDPETRYTQSGQSVCSFSVATNRKWTNQDGTPGEETVWWRVSAWGRLGETCQQYLNKGRLVLVEGEMVPDRENGGPRVWTDQSGQPRASFELRAATVKFLGGRDEGGFDSDYGSSGSSARQNAPAQSRSSTPQRQAPQRQAPAQGRRTTMAQPPADDFGDDDRFDPDEIPF